MKTEKNSSQKQEFSIQSSKNILDSDNITDVFSTVFKCTPTQCEVFSEIMKNGEICIERLEHILDKERSCVQKILSQLLNFGLIERRSVNFGEFNEICLKRDQISTSKEQESFKKSRKQGYLYLYRVIDKNKLQIMMEERIAELRHDMENLLKKYP